MNYKMELIETHLKYFQNFVTKINFYSLQANSFFYWKKEDNLKYV